MSWLPLSSSVLLPPVAFIKPTATRRYSAMGNRTESKIVPLVTVEDLNTSAAPTRCRGLARKHHSRRGRVCFTVYLNIRRVSSKIGCLHPGTWAITTQSYHRFGPETVSETRSDFVSSKTIGACITWIITNPRYMCSCWIESRRFQRKGERTIPSAENYILEFRHHFTKSTIPRKEVPSQRESKLTSWY
jgi:hypothetical protein